MFRQDREEELVLPYSCISSQIVADTDSHTDTDTDTDTDQIRQRSRFDELRS